MPGGETEKDISAWTTDSLKEHMEARLEMIQQHFEARIDNYEKRLLERQQAQQEAITQVRTETATRLAESDKAIQKSETANERRFESVNEFRGQLNDQVKTFLPRDTYDAFHTALSNRVGVLENQIIALQSEKRGAGDQTKAIYALAGFVSVLLVIGTILAANGVFGK